jgi:ribonuclease Z
MVSIVVLGSASAVPDENHANTHFAIKSKKRLILVDCVAPPIVRLKKAGLDYQDISDVFLTHFHPDHISGVPSLMMNMWLLGHRKPLNVYGLKATIDPLEQLMDAYGWDDWPNFFPVTFHRLPETRMTLALEDDEYRVFTSPVRHLVPTMGLRIEARQIGKIIAYSCDTEPCIEVEELASGADILIHEATGEARGHSSAYQAGEVAQKAQAKSLYLIHYSSRNGNLQQLVDDAKSTFSGKTTLSRDFMEIQL